MKSVREQVWDNLVDAQVWTQVMYQVGKDGVYVNQVWGQVVAQVLNQVDFQVGNQVYDQVSYEIRS